MDRRDINKIHIRALSTIIELSSVFWASYKEEYIINNFQNTQIVNVSDIVYPPRLGRNTLKNNKINYFSDHLPIFKEVEDNMLIISWNIGIGENNSPCPYQLVESDMKDAITFKLTGEADHKKDTSYIPYYKNDVVFKTDAVETIVNIIYKYITEMKKCGKTIVLHLQECSFGAYFELKKIFEGVFGENFSGGFMPKEIAKIKSKGEPKLFYIEEKMCEYPASNNKLGLSSFIFPTSGVVSDIKICPTSAELYQKGSEIVLSSRINLVLIELDEKKYIHYNLHLKKEGGPKSPVALNKSTRILNLYAAQKFINIETDDKIKNMEFKNDLTQAIMKESSRNNIIEAKDGKLKFKNEEQFNIAGPRYMCGDYNAVLSSIRRELDSKIIIDRIPPDMVDYIVKIEPGREEEAARRPLGVEEDEEDQEDKKLVIFSSRSLVQMPAPAPAPVPAPIPAPVPAQVPAPAAQVPAPAAAPSGTGSIDFTKVAVGDKFKYLGKKLIGVPAPNGISENDTFEIMDIRDINNKFPSIKIRVNDGENKSIKILSLNSDKFEKIVSGGSYLEKYLKYKNKYLKLKKELEL